MKTINNLNSYFYNFWIKLYSKKNNDLVIFPKLSNKILSKKLTNIPKVIQLKKVKKENDFLIYFKNHFNDSKQKEKYKINLMYFINEKKEKKKIFKNINNDLEDMKKEQN